MTIFAPAKVNLFLHVTGRRPDGHHLLDSLVTFADIGDRIRFDPAPDFSFAVEGPFGGAFVADEKACGPESKNLAVQAVRKMAEKTGRTPRFRLTLTKNLPLGAGLGGGSSDAAAVLWGLMDLWNIPAHAPFLPDLMINLGADVPVCVSARPAMVGGIGEVLRPAPDLPEIPVVLVWPGRGSNTAKTFKAFRNSDRPFRETTPLPASLNTMGDVVDFLETTGNDLLESACVQVPEIQESLKALKNEPGCALVRMTGSGSACFGLFTREEDASAAALSLARTFPRAWIRSGWLGRTERY
ncbi:MAG: 4-(cytidine 5'-diphospho)-2-C-methyl-D-erythritol kinase [Rhodospirillales bacterium]|nr:4-(cytidine 5'-diphospho)-2-C-methyl-D-erythritol kinase [Rhodospirillales bacterium]